MSASRITRLSESSSCRERTGSAVVLVGSFAPIHKGHFDAVRAASAALIERFKPVESIVFTPNSAEYVDRKLRATQTTWTYERRIQTILSQEPHPCIPTYVDDISGRLAGLSEINDYVPSTVQHNLGFAACQTYLVVGSDQLLSMEAHLADEANQAVCVLRPNNLDAIDDHLSIPWVADSLNAGRYIITEREDMETDISSTRVRDLALAGAMPELVH